MTIARPKIAVTMGDPAGIGPELCLRLLANEAISEHCQAIVFGDATVLERVAAKTSLPFPEHTITGIENAGDSPALLDLATGLADDVEPGRLSPEAGKAAFAYVEAAIAAALAGTVGGVTTAPLNKAALHAAGIDFPGHTEIFAERTGTERFCMMQYSEIITCSFVTVHVGYHEVPNLLTESRILDVIELTRDTLVKIRKREPALLVCGLNPHAGENGLFGNREEESIILPAIETARSRGFSVEGPVPPDTAFTPTRLAGCDAVVCLYHDQGHIPVKALAFDTAVNTTLGIPFPRTSVDHGTAFDIAWQGIAGPSSLFKAVELAAALASG
ncbi:MAG: 4-hydroxythreonine-4-phosphate dehydrogenase PdxA [Verrucomicrobiales bacterium]